MSKRLRKSLSSVLISQTKADNVVSPQKEKSVPLDISSSENSSPWRNLSTPEDNNLNDFSPLKNESNLSPYSPGPSPRPGTPLISTSLATLEALKNTEDSPSFSVLPPTEDIYSPRNIRDSRTSSLGSSPTCTPDGYTTPPPPSSRDESNNHEKLISSPFAAKRTAFPSPIKHPSSVCDEDCYIIDQSCVEDQYINKYVLH